MERTRAVEFEAIVGSDRAVWEIRTSGPGPAGRLPLTAEMLLERPSGDIFGLTQNAGMGWDPRELGRPQFLMLSTLGGMRARRSASSRCARYTAKSCPTVAIGSPLPPSNFRLYAILPAHPPKLRRSVGTRNETFNM